MSEIPSCYYKELQEQRRDLEILKEQKTKEAETFEQMRQFMQRMNAAPPPPVNTTPIFVVQHLDCLILLVSKVVRDIRHRFITIRQMRIFKRSCIAECQCLESLVLRIFKDRCRLNPIRMGVVTSHRILLRIYGRLHKDSLILVSPLLVVYLRRTNQIDLDEIKILAT